MVAEDCRLCLKKIKKTEQYVSILSQCREKKSQIPKILKARNRKAENDTPECVIYL